MSSPALKSAPSFLDRYEEEGYAIQPDVFSPAEREMLIAAGRELEDFKAGITKPAMMPHRENDVFLQAMKNPKIVATMEKILGGTVSALQTEFFYCKPGTRGFSNHQDNFFVQAPMGAFGSAWVALTDTYKEKGGLIVYPGTQAEGLLPVRKLELSKDAGQDPNANNEECVIPAQYPPMNASVPAGSALYIHGHLVHGSNPNATDEWRYVLLITYVRKGEAFRAGKYAQRAEVDVYN